MNIKILAAIATVMTVLANLQVRLGFTGSGTTVTTSGLAVLAATLILAAAGLIWMCVRSCSGFRSSPYLRTAGRA